MTQKFFFSVIIKVIKTSKLIPHQGRDAVGDADMAVQ